ncbi:hypothetical protein FJZ36_00125 [Candidatus Poribacteria bacterium]|nr:hypothetical protein [Candidatus Poribacteria bacterium]
MELEYKPDFDRAMERMEAWWHCEVIDRACVQITIPRKEGNLPTIPSKRHETLRERWMDSEFQVEAHAASMAHRKYLGESFPAYLPNLGPDQCATLVGAELVFSPGTSWAVPFVKDWKDVDWTPQFTSIYWQTLRDMTELSIEMGRGKYITALTDLHMNGDLLSAMRGREELCVDLKDRPDEVREAIRKAGELYAPVYDDLWLPIRDAGLGSTTWMSVYHDGRCYGTNMDFAGLISPDMFNDFFLPVIVDETRFLDRSCFHLDGPTALVHLDTLLSIPELNGVQWVFGSGNEPCTRWIDVYRRIQQAGKCAQVIIGDVREIEQILEVLPPNGLLFTGGGWGMSEDEVEALLKRVEKLGAKHAHAKIGKSV